MATAALRNIRWAGREGALGNPVEFYDSNIKEANSQSFVAGDLVTITPGTGTVAEYATQGRALSGIALTAATNVTTGNVAIRIQKILPGEIYIANVYHATAASAVTAITQIGNQYALQSTSAGVWAVGLSDSTITNAIVQVVGFVYGPDTDTNGAPYVKALGDTYGEVYVKFMTGDGTTSQLLDFGGI